MKLERHDLGQGWSVAIEPGMVIRVSPTGTWAAVDPVRVRMVIVDVHTSSDDDSGLVYLEAETSLGTRMDVAGAVIRYQAEQTTSAVAGQPTEIAWTKARAASKGGGLMMSIGNALPRDADWHADVLGSLRHEPLR